MNTLELEHRFEEIYGKRAEHTYFAPGRVNLIGEHTDYNGGLGPSLCVELRDLSFDSEA